MTESKSSPIWDKAKIVLSWVFGVLLAISGVTSLAAQLWFTGLLLLGLGLYLIPLIQQKIPLAALNFLKGDKSKANRISYFVAILFALGIDGYNAQKRDEAIRAAELAELSGLTRARSGATWTRWSGAQLRRR